MTSTLTSRGIKELTTQEPTYQDLIDLYNELRTSTSNIECCKVCQRALTQVIGEIIDYLDFVGTEIEKTVGLTRTEERERILREFSEPAAEDPVNQIAEVIDQWESIELYTQKDIQSIHEQTSST